MDDGIEAMLVSVRADTGGFARDVESMRAQLKGGLGDGAEAAGRAVERSLLRAVRSGKLEFDDLKTTALAVLNEIAAAGIRGAIGSLGQGSGGGGGGGGLGAILAGLIGAASGAPGRATGGPVTPGRAYMVGERGPELFVPTTSGRVETGAGSPRDVRVAITVRGSPGEAPALLARSGRQVARAVRTALEE